MANVVDSTLQIQGYALKSVDGKFEPWSYHPRLLHDDEVEVAITHCGICASDIHTAFGGWGKVQYPLIVGHEIIGNITKIGAAVSDFTVGDRVGVGAQAGACCDFGTPCSDCATGDTNHCEHFIGTYNGVYPDGEQSQGGYATMKRLNQKYVFHIPDAISSPEAAPLLCAGATVYAPLRRYGAGPGKRVGIIGIGGLGHLAIQYAAKMGAETVALGTSLAKRDLSIKLGAVDYVNIKDDEALKTVHRSFDLIICTADVKGQAWDRYISLGKLDSHFILVSIPDEPIAIGGMTLVFKRVNVNGSSIGSPAEIKEMLEFSAEHNIRPMIELMPMSKVNEGIEKVRKNDVKFRVVLEQGK